MESCVVHLDLSLSKQNHADDLGLKKEVVQILIVKKRRTQRAKMLTMTLKLLKTTMVSRKREIHVLVLERRKKKKGVEEKKNEEHKHQGKAITNLKGLCPL